ncbi:MAG TPA: ABC-F family ATP-binding cassette domain-containing protein [Candidatus Limivivens intestinipullorum]|uniref:ABC-F family ATP-binding cassette domain-containing protein n=1 Tax=Candidatus Limivivens intestinipullorum TaxID=2840858 RepID=A0A9D1JL48_9FIRM|nr:ABC-F family ATP-binding cassette domain-containing protein [Candidatus Limivivens intestinipullorum]
MTNLLTMENLTKVYTQRRIFDQTDFSVGEGEKIGIIGINGTGKSTLLRMAAGLEEPDEGRIVKGNHTVIRYLPQKPEFDGDCTILEAVVRENKNQMNEWSIESEARAMLMELGFSDMELRTGVLSGGQKKRVALAATLLGSFDLLLLDEPTNHLDGEMAQWLEEYLAVYKGALVLVTHDRYFLDRVVTRIVELDRGKIYSYPGSYSEFIRLKEARESMELASQRKRKSVLRKELEWLARGARARSTKQKAHIQRIEQMQSIQDRKEEETVRLGALSSRLGKKTIELSDIRKELGGRLLIRDFSYIFLKGDRVGIVGPNGCGKTTLLKIITGELEADAGTRQTGQTVKIGYFVQEAAPMDPSVRVIDYVKEAGELVVTPEGTITAAQMLERFLFDGSMQWGPVEKLSGGEKRRLYLLRILMGAPNVLILDEPTNDLDIQTLTILEDYLDSFDGIVITVSHDRYFLDRVVQRIFAFEENGEIRQYEGGYTDYRLAAAGQEEDSLQTEEKEEKKKPVKSDWKQNRQPKARFSFKDQREYETIDEEIAGLESRLADLEAGILKNASDFVKLNELTKEKEEVEEKLEEKMERWVYLNELAEMLEKK